jgi:hypothetical protein
VGGVDVEIHEFLASAVGGGELSASRPSLFTPRENAPPVPMDRRFGVDPRASLDDVEKRKLLTLPGLELQPLGRPARSQSLYRQRHPACM